MMKSVLRTLTLVCKHYNISVIGLHLNICVYTL